MNQPTFPRAEIPGVEVSDESRELIATANQRYAEWRHLKIGMAAALIRKGTEPHRKPPASIVERRRKANKAARKARRGNR